MKLTDAYRALGQQRFDTLLSSVSIGALKTYSVYDGFKIRSRLGKLNRQRLRRASPRLWERITEGDGDLARDFAQAILVSNIEFIVNALDFLEVPHDGNGFFDKEADPGKKLSNGWRQKVFDEFRERYGEDLVLFYINHLDWEMGLADEPFTGAAQPANALSSSPESCGGRTADNLPEKPESS